MYFLLLAAFTSYWGLVVAFDSVSDAPAEDITLASHDIFLESEGIIGDSNVASSDNLLNFEGTHNLFSDSEASITSSNLFFDSEGTSIAEGDIAVSDVFLDPNEINPLSDFLLGLSDDTNILWDEEFLSTDTSLPASCATTSDELRLEARDGESCAVQSPDFQLPSDLQRLYEDPLDLVEDSLDPKKDDEPWKPRIYAEGDSLPTRVAPEVMRKLLVEDPCVLYEKNLCCDGPAEEAPQAAGYRIFYSKVENCDPGT
jgi:hypothetical protein